MPLPLSSRWDKTNFHTDVIFRHVRSPDVSARDPEYVFKIFLKMFILQGDPGSGISVVSPYRMNPGYRRPRPAPGTDSDHGYSTMTPYGDQVRIAPHRNTVSDEVLNFCCCVADPGFFLNWIPIRIFNPGSKVKKFPDPGFASATKDFSIFYQKKLLISSRKYAPGFSSRIRILTFYPSRIQGSKRQRIPDPDPQHCFAESGS